MKIEQIIIEANKDIYNEELDITIKYTPEQIKNLFDNYQGEGKEYMFIDEKGNWVYSTETA